MLICSEAEFFWTLIYCVPSSVATNDAGRYTSVRIVMDFNVRASCVAFRARWLLTTESSRASCANSALVRLEAWRVSRAFQSNMLLTSVAVPSSLLRRFSARDSVMVVWVARVEIPELVSKVMEGGDDRRDVKIEELSESMWLTRIISSCSFWMRCESWNWTLRERWASFSVTLARTAFLAYWLVLAYVENTLQSRM